MKNIEYTDGFLLISTLGQIYRLENWGKVTAKLVSVVGKNVYLINKEVNLTTFRDYKKALQTRYRPFFLQINDFIIYDNELLQVVGFERNSDNRNYMAVLDVFDSNGTYKYTVKYVCDEKFIKGFEYADRI